MPALSLLLLAATLQAPKLRPPAVPLVTHDPYFSIWSEGDEINGTVTRHWTHRPNAIHTAITIDGKTYLLVGRDANLPKLTQLSSTTTATSSAYLLTNSQVLVSLKFTSPLLPNDLDVFTRPVTYMSYSVASADNQEHKVAIQTSVSGQLTVNDPKEPVTIGVDPSAGMPCFTAHATNQHLLSPAGDDVRIDWGTLYVASPGGDIPAGYGSTLPADTAYSDFPAFTVGTQPVERHTLLAYDELYEVKYFGKNLRPYWKRNGDTPEQLLAKAEKEYPRVLKACGEFDAKLNADMTKVGGAQYAQLCALAYRQAIAATGIAADAKGQPLLFTKENTSNGDIATVDVIFPMDPIFILLSPALAKASLVPDLDYAASDHWKFPNAPHDLGTYPIANGTDDGGEGMPVEESGNMLILCDAISQSEGSAKWVTKWWPKLTQWETYLQKYGYDPEDQLCTDDFMGHLAHNANLSIKAILGIAAYGDMARLQGDTGTADRIRDLALKYAAHFMQVANAGDHTLLAFDKPNTWSQKYNLVWDRILNLNVFPPSLAAEEIAYYKTVMQPYGVPLDSRTHLTKTDWSVWSASLATNSADFKALVAPIYNYMNTTTNRQPMVDSYMTDNLGSDGMHARSVVGGVFIRALTDREVWFKWAHADEAKVGPWAPFPKRPVMLDVIPSSLREPQTWRFSLAKPAEGWQGIDFDDSSWTSAPGPFGSDGTPGIKPGTQWTSDDIWLRREVTVPAGSFKNLQLVVYHDEDIEVYVNGILAGSLPGYMNSYAPLEMTPEAKSLFKPGAKLTLAVHCHQTTGGQGVDVGVVDVK